MINTIHLRTFMQLCDHLHFTRTAETLNMTQPGVTQHIKALEAEMGSLLIHRQGKKIELTRAGRRLYQYAQDQQKAEKRLREELGDDSPHHGTCEITCSGTLALQLYPQFLALNKSYPKLHIFLEAAPNARSIELVKNNLYAIGLITQYVDDPSLDIQTLGHEELCLVLPKGHSAKWADLLTLGYIDHPNGAHYANQVLEKNYPDDFTGFQTLKRTGYINQINQILAPVAQGLGFTVLPESTLAHFSRPDLLERAPLKNPCRETIYRIAKKYQPLPQRYQQIDAILRDLLSPTAP